MKKFTITENGTFELPFRDFDRASFFLVGSLGGGATVELLCFDIPFHLFDQTIPQIISMGRGAPLKIRITGATTFVDTEMVAYEVK